MSSCGPGGHSFDDDDGDEIINNNKTLSHLDEVEGTESFV